MSKNAKPAATKPAEVAGASAPKSNKKVVIIAVVVVAALAGGAGWFLTRGKPDTAGHVEEAKVEAPKKALFIPLEAFTVNLQKETSDQYLQVGMTLKYFEPELEDRIKSNLPEIRSKILLLLATKTASELASPEGKTRLINEVRNLSNQVLGIANPPAPGEKPASAPANTGAAADAHGDAEHAAPNPAAGETVERKGIVDVLFTSFIIQ
jgi:flagellar FliL protein